MIRSILWFRKGLRLHDNRALLEACREMKSNKVEAVFPVFIIDPFIISKVGHNRMLFLLESLSDLDTQLQLYNSRLFVLKGKPEEVLPELYKQWRINKIAFEYDSEPYAIRRDELVKKMSQEQNVEVCVPVGHTLFRLTDILDQTKDGKPPVSYSSFLKCIEKLGEPEKPVHLDDILAPHDGQLPGATHDIFREEIHSVPTMTSLGLPEIPQEKHTPYYGGETVALERMKNYLKQKKKVANFSKPDTAPTDFNPPSTTVLSPYLKFGCLSSRTFYYELKNVLKEEKKHTKPPESLLGQLYWREFFYCNAFGIKGFESMKKNRICLQVPWDESSELLNAWKEARTGFPWIDACMTQLRTEGWMHHLARHSVACFLTRGDLWQSWEKGRDVFDELLLDADWSLNNGNWLWLSSSAFYHQYYRVYSPIAFPKKTDKSGQFVRKYLPILKKFPDKYIYEPWNAPLSVQKQCGCIIGKDYPSPIVDHAVVSKRNIEKMKKAYADKQYGKYSDEEQPTVKKEEEQLNIAAEKTPVVSRKNFGFKRKRKNSEEQEEEPTSKKAKTSS